GGKYKGKTIEIPDIHTTRSSKSILKESLFNTLQFDIIDKNFVEVFAGSGSIGLEASSRGAGECYFIENNRKAYNILQSNIKKLQASNCNLFFGDSFEKFPFILDALRNSPQKTYFYFDPPFSTRDGMDEIYDNTIKLIENIDVNYCEMVIVEHMTNLDMPNKIADLKLIKRKKFGRSTISYFRPKED
nr:16S rRNA (guanine(966)-N(2))-methyltransferase RsmD [Sulfurovaceae bacterium]